MKGMFLYNISYALQYVVPVAVNYSYCASHDGYGKYPKRVEWSCISLDILCVYL
jgi:uncharacterized membrane protein YhdT